MSKVRLLHQKAVLAPPHGKGTSYECHRLTVMASKSYNTEISGVYLTVERNRVFFVEGFLTHSNHFQLEEGRKMADWLDGATFAKALSSGEGLQSPITVTGQVKKTSDP